MLLPELREEAKKGRTADGKVKLATGFLEKQGPRKATSAYTYPWIRDHICSLSDRAAMTVFQMNGRILFDRC
jgi:hypothetical protein